MPSAHPEKWRCSGVKLCDKVSEVIRDYSHTSVNDLTWLELKIAREDVVQTQAKNRENDPLLDSTVDYYRSALKKKMNESPCGRRCPNSGLKVGRFQRGGNRVSSYSTLRVYAILTFAITRAIIF